MARPTKQGLDYYPYDVDADQDDKLGMIIAEFNVKGELFWLKLLAWIYKNEGYFTEWNEDAQLRFLRRYNYCGFSVGFIQEVVPRLIKWGLLDQAVFAQFHILTSKRIQNTWYSATRKRKCKVHRPEIWIHDVIDGNKAEETELKAEETTQRKGNKRKEKENVDDVPPPIPASLMKGIEDLKADCLKDRVYFVEHVARQCGVSPESIPNLLEAFNAHLKSIGETLKGARDYRQHAQHWIKKQDVSKYTAKTTQTVDETMKRLGL